MIKKLIKYISKKIFTHSWIRHGKDFDFELYLINNNFVLNQCNEETKIYVHKQCKFLLIINIKNPSLSIISKKNLVSKLNFIPNSEVFSLIYLNLTIKNLTNNESV